MIFYLLKASIVVAVALLFYKILLQQETFFRANRVYFIVFLAFAFTLPSVKLPKLVTHQGFLSSLFYKAENTGDFVVSTPAPVNTNFIKKEKKALSEENAIDVSVKNDENTADNSSLYTLTVDRSPIFWFVLFYFFGVMVFALNLLFQATAIIVKIFKSEDKIQDGKYIIVNAKPKQAPCSFFNYIFIHPDEYDFETYEQIIAHEKIHVNQGHSWDLLIAEIGVIFLWFNPLVWIYKREIEKNIEYETDTILLNKKQVQKDQYQLSLLQIAAPNKPLTITTNYNQSLLKQRILMMNAKKSTLSSYWKYAFLAPLLLGTILLLNEPVSGQTIKMSDKNAVNAPKELEGSEKRQSTHIKIGNNADMSQGFWYSREIENEYCIDFKDNSNSSRWNISTCFEKSDFEKQENEVFILKRETGTLKIIGALDKEVSQGKYVFTKDDSFESYLIKNDLSVSDKNFMFHLFLNDVSRKYVDYLKDKYKTLTGDQLLAMSIHEVDKNYIESLSGAGFKNLEVEQLLAAKIHDINPKTIKEIQALGFGNPGIEKMIALQIHGVNAQYIADLKSAGFANLDLDQIIEAKIHDVNPKTIKEMQSMGFNDLSMRKIVELKIHGVNAGYIEGLKTSGFKNLNLDQIIEAKIHDIDPQSIKEIQSLGFEDLSLRKIIDLKIHGVNAAYMSDLKNAGFKDLSMDEILQAKIHGVNSTTIKEAKSLGYGDLSLKKIIEATIHGVNAEFIESLKSVGFNKLDINDVINAKIHDVDGSFIKEAKDDGFDYSTIDEYINLKIHGIAKNSKRK
ncbi:MAG TPA: M56 family metallopeptidase [Cytophagales bacterium]|nr:M56 family metallopeptidase [Cytophagales bacterium]